MKIAQIGIALLLLFVSLAGRLVAAAEPTPSIPEFITMLKSNEIVPLPVELGGGSLVG